MGNLITCKPLLRQEYKEHQKWTLTQCRQLVSRFENIQESFGWGIRIETFAKLFKMTPTAALPLWRCWDTDNNGITDVLEILAGLTLVCTGKFEDKLEACFNLFDFDENQVLTMDEMMICIKTSVCGLCKLMDLKEPDSAELEVLAQRAFEVADDSNKKDGKITREEFLSWVVYTPAVIKLICSFGTTNGDAIRTKYAKLQAEDKAAQKIQRAYKKHQPEIPPAQAATLAVATAGTGRGNGKKDVKSRVNSIRRANDPATTQMNRDFRYNTAHIRTAKSIFDKIDTDRSGSISVKELLADMYENNFLDESVNAFRSLDQDGNGMITFEEMLHVLYPGAKPRDVKTMIIDIKQPTISREIFDKLQSLFEDVDDDFDARVNYTKFLKAVNEDKALAELIHDYQQVPKLAKQSFSFPDLIIELFSRSHRSQISELISWAHANPVANLTDDQQLELEQLFRMYDKDGSGTIDMIELKEHFTSLGFTKQENEKMFAKYDRDGSNAVDLIEFKRFYRSVWDSSNRIQIIPQHDKKTRNR